MYSIHCDDSLRYISLQHYTLLTNGLRQSVVETRYNADGTLASQTQTNWTYDDDGRLIREALSILQGTSSVAAYADSFKFDLESNRVEEDIDAGNDGTTDDTIAYTYNHDDQVLTETEVDATSATVYTITYGHTANGVFVQGYDATGNMTEKHRTGTELEDDTYTWNLAGQMTSATVNGVTTTYTYDANGVRISETTGNATTYYLNDPENPTGYAKAIEEKTVTIPQTPVSTAAPSRSYIFGLKVEGQSDATNGTVFLVTDGHGSTRVVISLGGVNQASYDYDAFGTALGFDASTAITPWLFAGDGNYDPASGFTYQLARWRDGFRFISSDTYQGDTQSPLTLHKYLYANVSPTSGIDPTGHFELLETLVTMSIQTAQFALRIAPVAKVAFAVWDGITILNILHKGMTQGFNKVTAWDWAQVALSSIGIVSAVPGTEALVRTGLSAFLHIPIGPALKSFEGAKLIVGQVAKLEQITEVEQAANGSVRLGQFVVDSAGSPVIRYFRTGNEIEDVTTLLHEMFHYGQWVALGKPAYTLNLITRINRLDETAETVAKLIMKLLT